MNDEERLNEEAETQLREAGVPKEAIRRWVAGNLRETAATRAVEEWWTKTDEFTLVLVGGVGCGKTLASLRFIVARKNPSGSRPSAMFLPVYALAGAPFDVLWEMRQRATRVQSLVYDEAGTEIGFAESQLYPILAPRIDNGLRTVITSNLPEAAFRERYGERVISRILGSGRIVVVHGPDLRIARPA